MGAHHLRTRFAVGVFLCVLVTYIPTLHSLFEEHRGRITFTPTLLPTSKVTSPHPPGHGVTSLGKARPEPGQVDNNNNNDDTDSDQDEDDEDDPGQPEVTTKVAPLGSNFTSEFYDLRASRGAGHFCIKVRGRLGSALSHLATLHAIVRETGRRPLLCPKNGPLWVLKDSFKAIIRTFDACFKTCPTVINIKSGSRYDPTLIPRVKATPHNTSLRLPGTIFSWRYFDLYRAEIRQLFTVHPRYTTFADRFIRNITASLSLHRDTAYVCVHVRRTDRLGDKDSKKGYVFPGPEYFSRAVEYFQNKYKHHHFVVCSDDIKWCKANLKFSRLTFSSGRNYKEDFAVLTRCNHSIITFGHFSWWGAYLAGGEVVYPAGAVKPGSYYAVKDKDRMPHTWIPL